MSGNVAPSSQNSSSKYVTYPDQANLLLVSVIDWNAIPASESLPGWCSIHNHNRATPRGFPGKGVKTLKGAVSTAMWQAEHGRDVCFAVSAQRDATQMKGENGGYYFSPNRRKGNELCHLTQHADLDGTKFGLNEQQTIDAAWTFFQQAKLDAPHRM